jgi:ubiquinone/menaquinone biosynthesis C-methylase UbiE
LPTYYQIIQKVIPEIEYHQNRYARGLAGLVQPGCRWLDIGAGTTLHEGWLGVKAAELADKAQFLVGCDVVETHLARNTLLHSATVSDAAQLPFRDCSFNLVTANMVVEHLANPESVFRQVARVLVPGGRFVFVTPNLNNPVVRTASVAFSAPVRKRVAHFLDGRADEHIFHTFYRANTASAIQRLASTVKLGVETLDTFNSFPYIRQFWPLTALEALWIKAITHSPLRSITTNIFCVLQKGAARER